ncbi:MAG: polysaccharide biosynthesis protein [Burkholderiales bacterium]|jgi:FlaA1/EpsC-like NDP-sugar epimerase|nr:polysaccharide biosynthesis protein [Burkholderiales bacterium]
MMNLLPRGRAWLAFFYDVIAALLAWTAIYGLRFSFAGMPMAWDACLATLVWVLPIQAVVCVAFGLYRGLWRYASLDDLKRIALVVGFATLAIPLILTLAQTPVTVPRTVLLLYPVVLIFLMAGSRFIYRMWREERLFSPWRALGEPILVLGAGAAGARLAEALASGREWRVAGFLDDDPQKQRRRIHSVPVLGPISELKLWVNKLHVQKIVLALPSANHKIRRQISSACLEAGVQAFSVPTYEDLLSGAPLTTLRSLDMEDLLGREPVLLDTHGLGEWLGNSTILVSGAGGSIGSELCRQILRYRPAKLVLLDISETAIYRIASEFIDKKGDTEIVARVGDVKDAALMETLLKASQPQTIFHAAAYKHVPLMEEAENAWQVIRNNTYGTYVLGRAAVAAGVEKFVMISTDKAVAPVSVMGASKQLAEMICQYLQNGSTQFVTVRFGNVLNSAGSVIPLFQKQIAQGGPVTVTHPEVTRYFMSIPEAVGLVMQAGLQGTGGDIVVLDMGEPIKIADLARNMIQLSGANAEQVAIRFTGLRAGEKLHEELLNAEETCQPTSHPKLNIARARAVRAQTMQTIIGVCEHAAPPENDVRLLLRQWLPDFQGQPKTHQ